MPESNDGATTPQAGVAPQSTTPDTTQTPSQVATPQAGTSTETPQAGTSTTEEEESISKSKAKELRNENATLRQRAKDAEDKARQLELEKMSESDRVKAERDEFKQKFDQLTETHRTTATFYEVALIAQKLGIIDPEAAAKLANWESLEYDNDGMPTNVEAILEGLIKEKPYLKGQTPSTGTPAPQNSGLPSNPASHTPGNSNNPSVRVPQSFKEYLENKGRIFDAMKQGTLSE